MLKWFVDSLIRRAARTPYFNLPGYMNRDWLVPYRQEQKRLLPGPWLALPPEPALRAPEPLMIETFDGTGPVPFLKRPIAWVLQQFNIAVRVHHILRSDRDRNSHDHPWPYLSIVLKVGYWEERYDDSGTCVSRRWHGPGSVIFRRAGSWHRLDIPAGKTAVTLFITFKYRQRWGFNVGGKKISYRDYTGEQ